jgi:hypothetical protein
MIISSQRAASFGYITYAVHYTWHEYSEYITYSLGVQLSEYSSMNVQYSAMLMAALAIGGEEGMKNHCT